LAADRIQCGAPLSFITGTKAGEYIAVDGHDVAIFTELSDNELDIVAGGTGPLVSINVPIAINVGTVVGTQLNIAALSYNVTQGNAAVFSLVQLAIA
jgi:hypothetical protein